MLVRVAVLSSCSQHSQQKTNTNINAHSLYSTIATEPNIMTYSHMRCSFTTALAVTATQPNIMTYSQMRCSFTTASAVTATNQNN